MATGPMSFMISELKLLKNTRIWRWAQLWNKDGLKSYSCLCRNFSLGVKARPYPCLPSPDNPLNKAKPAIRDLFCVSMSMIDRELPHWNEIRLPFQFSNSRVSCIRNGHDKCFLTKRFRCSVTMDRFILCYCFVFEFIWFIFAMTFKTTII